MPMLLQMYRHVIHQVGCKSMILGLVGVALLAGCEDPVARQHIAAREENMRNTVRMMQETEDSQARALAYTLNAMQEQNDLDMQRTAENPGKVNAMIDEDFRRFRENQPLYRQEIENQLKGNPDKIVQTLPDMLY